MYRGYTRLVIENSLPNLIWFVPLVLAQVLIYIYISKFQTNVKLSVLGVKEIMLGVGCE